METIKDLQAEPTSNKWLDFDIYPPKSETYAEFMCINPSLYKYNNVVIRGKYVYNSFCDEVGIRYRRMTRKQCSEDGFVPIEYILAWKIIG